MSKSSRGGGGGYGWQVEAGPGRWVSGREGERWVVKNSLEPRWLLLDVALPEETRGLLVDQRRDPFCHRLFGARPPPQASFRCAATASKQPHTCDTLTASRASPSRVSSARLDQTVRVPCSSLHAHCCHRCATALGALHGSQRLLTERTRQMLDSSMHRISKRRTSMGAVQRHRH